MIIPQNAANSAKRPEPGTQVRELKLFFFFIILVNSSLDCRPNSESKARHDFGKRCLAKQFEPVTVVTVFC